MNKSEMVYEQKRLAADLIGCGCFGIDEGMDISEYGRSIDEINSMINYCIAAGNREEVSEWRKMLQQAKVEKRRAKKMADSKNRMGAAYT